VARQRSARLEQLVDLSVAEVALAHHGDAEGSDRLFADHHGNANRTHGPRRARAGAHVAALIALQVAQVDGLPALDGESCDSLSDGDDLRRGEHGLGDARRVRAHVQHAVGAERVDGADLGFEMSYDDAQRLFEVGTESLERRPGFHAFSIPESMNPGIRSLEGLLAARGAIASWLDAARRDIGALSSADFDDERLLLAFSSAGRPLGKAALAITADESERLASQGVTWRLDGWGVDELGRVLFLGAAFDELDAQHAARILEACYERGDNRERQAVLRALPFVPDNARFLSLAVDACRTSVQTVFEAIACENPFPADRFPDSNMNQMVLKAMFNGVALARIVRLGERAGPELARMAADYAAERRAAGRSVPADIDLVLGQPATNGGKR
jgi:hypothetical protein